MTQPRIVAAACALIAFAGSAWAQEAAEDPAAQPSWIAPLAAKSLLLDLARAGPRVFVVGERGHVLYSTDEGATWTQVQVPTSASLTAVYFADEKHGWAVGHDEVILRTTDGGDSWQRTHFAPENYRPLLDVWFADASRGYAVGAYGTIYASTDGGASWSLVPFEPEGLGDRAAPVDPEDYTSELSIDFHLNAILADGVGRLYLGAEAGRLFRSDDGGATWKELPSPYDGSFFGLLSLGGDSLLAFGLRGHVFRSDDAGQSWTRSETGTVALLGSAARLDAGTLVVAGLAGVLLVSKDDGHSFTLTQQDDRKGIAAILLTRDGELIVAGEGGVHRLPIPAAR
jgi:photosystem II stability/assembly factor-like uncharacterized protein